MAEIRVQNLHKAFADFTAVKDSSFTVQDGEFFCLLGPSGCGKTTTLRMIAGLELPTSGQIFLGNEDVTFKRASHRDIAFVFQLFALYPHLNVRRNIAFPLVSQGVPRGEIAAKVAEAARVLRIEHLLDKPVSGLSSGDRQRVALGRAIVRQPMAFMMDEPLGALDSEFRELMCQELRGLHDRLKATTVYVTHDQLEAMSMADTIAIMNQGVIEQLGAPQEVYDRPASVFVADFIGSPSMNFLPFEGGYSAGARQVRLGEALVAAPELREDAPAQKLLYGVRPEHVRFSADSAVRAEVLGTEYLGTSQIVTCQTAQGTLLRARVGTDVPAQRGDHVGLAFDAAQVSLFDAAGGRALRTVRHEAASPTRASRSQAVAGAAHG
ncbi:ABC transporter ATP-binding protein [Rhizobacter sp. AJA081-3]|uniref:ABC transporter ATP-binding protein n=1 Tax=Rhizobacter sp. AJA081-3 TaxID=2753607 RepID=UPI001ADF1131|nr:ABC transporter ATP-binding protein [Rhizobacter sp. AJA081-3]QTN24770.1 ABC transporter ATP-binding protein [Rhizobacter sp. AJA081-3]